MASSVHWDGHYLWVGEFKFSNRLTGFALLNDMSNKTTLTTVVFLSLLISCSSENTSINDISEESRVKSRNKYTK